MPTGYTAYEKWAAGWIDYNEFKEYNDTIKNLKSTYNGGNTYVIYNDRLRETNNADAREYFLFENRTQNRWDTYIPAQGLEVIHVNYVKSVWDANAVNTPSSSYGGNGQSNLILVPADNSNTGSYYDTGESTDLYPYNRKDSITPDSRPSLTFYNNQNDGQKVFQKKIVQIKWNSSDSTASFIYNPMPSAYTPAPVISGEQYFADSTVVTITADKGNIRYSTDSINWQEYSVPIVLRDSAKIYAYAYRSDGNNSEVTSMEFIKMKKIDAPVISGDSVFTSTTRVTISAPAGRIMYSLQSNGGTTFRNYSHSFTLSKSDVVYAFVTTTAKGYINSDTVSMKFRKEETPTGISGITAPATNFVSVYTIDGQLVATSQRLENIVLRRGTYIVRDQNGRTRKIALK